MEATIGFVGKRFSVVKVFGTKPDTLYSLQIEMNK